MIGRAVMGNPWLLKRVNQYLQTGELLPEATPEQKIAWAQEHLHALCVAKGPQDGPRDFRNQVAYYLKGIPHAARTKVALTDATDEATMQTLLEDFLTKLTARNRQRPVPRYR
jgi:tRNA-dihydrouridine synthase